MTSLNKPATFTLPPLPFSMDALMPIMSAETVKTHYESHHRGYVTKLNKLVQDTEYANADLVEIIMSAKGPLFNNASQVWNHTFFWDCLTSKEKSKPTAELSSMLDQSFGGMEKFQTEFSKAAMDHFGSGWVWLLKDKSGKLVIESTSNADNPMTSGKTPLLTLDVWEHAYYLDYRSARAEYVKSWWNIVNWDFVNRRALQGNKR